MVILAAITVGMITAGSDDFFFFCVPQQYLWGSPLLGEIFAYVTVFLVQPLR